MSSPPVGPPAAAVFLSYAREDSGSARKLAEALRAADVEVWLDEDELQGGDAWDAKIRRQIRECALFVPLISAATQARHEGYFRLEWHLGEQRSLLIAKGRPFLVPVALDDTSEREASVPDAFLAVQWTRLRGGEATRAWVERLRGLLEGPRSEVALKHPSLPTADSKPHIPEYEVLRIIGRGSYGDVWLARGVTGLWRAIKVVWRARFADAGPFEREFKGLKEFAAISLGESIQLALLHVGRNDEAGFFYYVMELADDAERSRDVEPATYAPLTLAALRAKRGRLPAADCIKYGVEIARALAGLHAHGLVHRDIKPSNVILVGGVPKLADIGLVALAADAHTFVGTEGYVPPEGPGAASADVFALGKVLYELSTGLDRQEFPQLPAEMKRLPDRREVLELNEIILRACDPLPERRYRDGGALLADLEMLQAGSSVRSRRSRRTLLQMASVVALAALVTVLLVRSKNLPASADRSITVLPATKSPVAASTGEKSIAVLPFANLSSEKDSEYFADGICEDVLTDLTGLRTLRVASRTSVLQYRDTKKTIPQIAKELGVRFILEGSVQRSGNTVRVHGQLIYAATDEHLWAKSYDGDLKNVFALQAEIAKDIAGALQTALSPEEKASLERRPTDNLAAYDLYLQARAILEKPLQGGIMLTVIAKLQQAVALDPKFAAAWATLGDCHAGLYFYEDDRSPERLALATQAIERAEQLAPDDPVVIARQGSFYLRADRDFIRATEQFLRLAQLRPNDPEVPRQLADIQAHQGRWAESIANSQRAQRLDPGNLFGAIWLIRNLIWVRHYDEAEALARHYTENFPEEEDFWWAAALVAFNARGSVAGIEDFAHRRFAPSRAERVTFLRKTLARIRGDVAEAMRLDRELPFYASGPPPWIQTVCTAISLENAGDVAAAQAKVRTVLGEMTAQAVSQPTSSWLQAWLGQAYALLGEREKALECSQRSVDLMSVSHDAVFGPTNASLAASVWARFGEKDRALAEFARLLQTPSSENVHAAHFGVSEYPTEVSWKPLVDDPQFQALLADPKNNAPLY